MPTLCNKLDVANVQRWDETQARMRTWDPVERGMRGGRRKSHRDSGRRSRGNCFCWDAQNVPAGRKGAQFVDTSIRQRRRRRWFGGGDDGWGRRHVWGAGALYGEPPVGVCPKYFRYSLVIRKCWRTNSVSLCAGEFEVASLNSAPAVLRFGGVPWWKWVYIWNTARNKWNIPPKGLMETSCSADWSHCQE